MLTKSLTKKLTLISFSLCSAISAHALDEASTVAALRMANTITGGFMPTTDPLFAQMVTQIANGNMQAAATIAATSPYFANYLAKRMAFQMQTPALDATLASDSDSTAFLIAHFVGVPASGVKPSISTIWSENQTYVVNIPLTVSGVTTITPTHVNQIAGASGFTLSPANVDWSSQLVTAGPQMAIAVASACYECGPLQFIPIPQKHVGGYLTASTVVYGKSAMLDSSAAQYGSLLGTNIRMIESFWEVSTGFSLTDFEDTTYASTALAQSQATPRFVPEDNPNFLHGQGQSACISCHGGGLSSLEKGYATVADIFDYDEDSGLNYLPDPGTGITATAQRKSLGSNSSLRSDVLTCTGGVPCNPDSPGVDAGQAWDLRSWASNGTLGPMGWIGSLTGNGLNSLGVQLGMSSIVYEFLTKRVIGEICPTGSFTAQTVARIAAAANPYAAPVPGTDDIRTIVALVAIDPSCQ
jgi:hypothetical protein